MMTHLSQLWRALGNASEHAGNLKPIRAEMAKHFSLPPSSLVFMNKQSCILCGWDTLGSINCKTNSGQSPSALELLLMITLVHKKTDLHPGMPVVAAKGQLAQIPIAFLAVKTMPGKQFCPCHTGAASMMIGKNNHTRAPVC